MKQCYLLIIASATEIVNGIENLWKAGPSVGRHNYPDFGKLTISKLLPLQHLSTGLRSNAGMKKVETFHGMCSSPACKVTIISEGALSLLS